MMRLAQNDAALLVKSGDEYWIVETDLTMRYLASQSENYDGGIALALFRRCYGEPTYTRPSIQSC